MYADTVNAALRVQTLQQEAQAIETLERQCTAYLDFGGINSTASAMALQRAEKGGLLSGVELLALAQLCDGGAKLQGTLRNARSSARNMKHEEAVLLIAERCAWFHLSCTGNASRACCVRDAAMDLALCDHWPSLFQ